MDNILVVICARGGSKGIKGKNIRHLLGRPLIFYTIRQALKWGRAHRVVVSTDSPKIAQIAKKHGAKVPFMRPRQISLDSTPKGCAIRHALIECEKLYGVQYDIVVDLDVTSPVRTPKDLDNCLKIFQRFRPKTLFSVVKSHKNPYFNMVEKARNGNVGLSKRLAKRPIRRQDVPAVYAMNASIYFYDRNHILASQSPSPFSEDTRTYVMEDVSSVDIDREIDFKFIEFLAKKRMIKL